jgi:hypothetical protein
MPREAVPNAAVIKLMVFPMAGSLRKFDACGGKLRFVINTIHGIYSTELKLDNYPVFMFLKGHCTNHGAANKVANSLG